MTQGVVNTRKKGQLALLFRPQLGRAPQAKANSRFVWGAEIAR